MSKFRSKISSMNSLDFLLILLAVFFVFIGYQKGLIGQLLSLGSLFISVYVAAILYKFLIPYLGSTQIDNQILISFVSFFIVFVACLVLIRVSALSLSKFLDKINIKWLNSFLGAILGFSKFALLLFMGIWVYQNVFINLFNTDIGMVKESYLFPKVQMLVGYFLDWAKTSPEYEEFTSIYNFM